MKSERPFSSWHVFVTAFALLLCSFILKGLLQFMLVEDEWEIAPWWLRVAEALFVGFSLGTLYLLRELWMEFRVRSNRRR